jgi:hypothetical protein
MTRAVVDGFFQSATLKCFASSSADLFTTSSGAGPVRPLQHVLVGPVGPDGPVAFTGSGTAAVSLILILPEI